MSVNIVNVADDMVKIKRVLVSVSNKSGLETFIPQLVEINPKLTIYSTGGTYTAIMSILGAKAEKRLVAVSDYTGQPETQGGLVKTLDFKIYLGLLTETHNKFHKADLKRTGAVPIDMVVVNLYPFAETIARKGTTVEEARANIDIGGPCMVRASAKNYLRVASVVNPSDYGPLIAKLRKNGGALSLGDRFELAKKAFAHTAEYDGAIAHFLESKAPAKLKTLYNLK